ncbi:MAG: LPS assembly protein LptD [Lentisphaeria bacterium]|nr:LPS assembly protein LptD [Lentisphaeria bacterium]
MTKRLAACQIFLVMVFLFTAAFAAAAAAEDEGASMRVEADDYNLDAATGVATGTGNVKIVYQGLVLEADSLTVNLKTKDVEAAGNVFLYSLEEPGIEIAKGHDFYWKGQSVKGNFNTRRFQVGASRGKLDEWYTVSKTGDFDPNGDVILTRVGVSTCEYLIDGHAHYRIEAKEVRYNSQTERFTAKHAVYKIGDVPVFYWPWIAWDTTNTSAGGIRFQAGHNSDWGAFLLMSRKWRINDLLQTEVDVDLMSQRGVGLGNETRLDTDRSASTLRLYYLADQDPPENDIEDGMNRRFDVESQRYRVHLSHMSEWVKGLTLRGNVDVLSDIDMLEEWFSDDFRTVRQPTSFADLRYEHELFTMSLTAKFRVNDFYTVSEKLPELRLDTPRRQVFGLPVYHQSETSLAFLRMNMRDFDVDNAVEAAFLAVRLPTYAGFFNDRNAYETFRFDTAHMVYAPFSLADVQIVPRGGVRLTYYDKTSARDVTDDELRLMFSFDDPDVTVPANNAVFYDDDGGSAWRFAGELGLEVSTKFTGVWENAENDLLDIDGLRHIVQPYLNYTYISDPNEERESLMYFDEIDRLREENFVRLGVNQRLQTRAGEKGAQRIRTLASWENYLDTHLGPAEARSRAGDFGSRLSFNPRDEMSFWGTALASMRTGRVRWFELGATLGRKDVLAFHLSWLARDDEQPLPLYSFGSTLDDVSGANMTSVDLGNSHLLKLGVDFRINDLTSGSAYYVYDVREGELERQVYQINRDLHCWTGSIYASEKDDDFTVGVALQLKAFPGVRISSGL